MGELICCDGCENSFHANCYNPPITAEKLKTNFYCYQCDPSEDGYPVENNIFKPLQDAFKSTNPASFSLPKSLWGQFDGVSSKDTGEYVDASEPRVPVYVSPFVLLSLSHFHDYLLISQSRDRDKDPRALCIVCHGSTKTANPIIFCDDCGSPWHLNCVDPPMANPPPISTDKKGHRFRAFFRCPRHADRDMRWIGNPMSANAYLDGVRTHRVRRRKDPKVVSPALHTGIRNNGV